MGRHRTIDREAVLDAAEKVVSRDGAARLTLEAVAAEAGISKASVLYDYKTKRALIRAVIERRVAVETAYIQTFVDALADEPDALIRGRIASAARLRSDQERAVAFNLCAALAQDAGLREPIQQINRVQVAEIASQSTHPRGAMLAFLAAQGLMMMEWFELHCWLPEERERLVADIGWLVDQSPTVPESSPGLPHQA
jgi:AcrR family transcriptional regulator